jgi:hypothetical protein
LDNKSYEEDDSGDSTGADVWIVADEGRLNRSVSGQVDLTGRFPYR